MLEVQLNGSMPIDLIVPRSWVPNMPTDAPGHARLQGLTKALNELINDLLNEPPRGLLTLVRDQRGERDQLADELDVWLDQLDELWLAERRAQLEPPPRSRPPSSP